MRNLTWLQVQQHLTEDLVRVHLAWQAHGPGTTRAVAQRAGISLLTFRPRTTDLYKLGLVVLVTNEEGEGVYAHRSRQDAEISLAWQERADFRTTGRKPSVHQERVGFVTVDDAVNSLEPAAQAALGARLLSRYGHLLKKRETTSHGSEQLSLLTA